MLADDLQCDRSIVGTADRLHQVVRVVDFDLVGHYHDIAASKSGFPRDRSLDDVRHEHTFRLYTQDVTEVAVEGGELGPGKGIESASKSGKSGDQ